MLNREPLRQVSQDDIENYHRDGAGCLRQVLHQDWIDSLLPAAKKIVVDKEEVGLLPNLPGRYMARCVKEFRRFVFESPVAEVAGQVMRSKEIRFFFDEIFAKAPKSNEKTIWHTDRMGWPVTGHMVPSIWIPLHSITKQNSLECIAGSQTQDVRYWLFSPNARHMI